jgi:hypothetical protein
VYRVIEIFDGITSTNYLVPPGLTQEDVSTGRDRYNDAIPDAAYLRQYKSLHEYLFYIGCRIAKTDEYWDFSDE